MASGRPGFNIAQFKSFADRSFMRPNKFLVQFTLPQVMQGNRVNNETYRTSVRQAEFWCEATNLPGIALQAHETRRYGYGAAEKRPAVPMFNDVQFAFYSDGEGAYWTLFQQWIKLIINYDMRNGISAVTGAGGISRPYEVSYKHEYVTDIRIYVYDGAGTAQLSVILREAYPLMVGDVPLNWSDTNSVMRIPVIMTFTDWYNEDVIDLPPSAIQPNNP